jgi:hypothetical protein
MTSYSPMAAIKLLQAHARSAGTPTPFKLRITDCGEGPIICNWTWKTLEIMLRMNHTYIPQDWTLRPSFHYWPAQRQAPILWLLVHFFHNHLRTYRRISLQDYLDFLRLYRWKAHQQPKKRPVTGRYLDVLGWPQPRRDNVFDPNHKLTIREVLLTSDPRATE